ncbi:NAD(P)-dependent oxidoreductase [cf. Phormidesmis sp. LEGE 11477]|uniref:NAD(P)-dependent oxidoreductase n=1 Tax=cf. Phormidesmis sp. LEGE 11477 TaxID=1828680 RepID=UPI0018805D85|nr:NAD(P)-dependent oxidoreductase [cf. Phormidesmis sp. LEGE 11477]MBE9062025.1 NAD(P)-dependent oxidoreductase [cf. Phormidesmis sp. LEGE 11477]
MNIAFVGLGTMGAPMVLNLLKAGYSVTVHNRTRAKEQPLVEAGAIAAPTPQAAAASADIVITCVSDTPDVEAVILEESGIIEGAQAGALVIDMSTISPSTTREIAARLAQKNIRMLDAPVSGGSEGAQKGTLSIMIGGEAADVERARPVLSTMGSTITHVGAIGAGQTTKAINQIIVAGTYWSVAEGMALGLKAGLNMEKVVQAVGSGAAGSWGLTNRSSNMIDNEYPLGFRVRLHQKDLEIALAAARELGLPLPMAAYVEQIETGLMAQGYGDEDISAIARTVRDMGAIE